MLFKPIIGIFKGEQCSFHFRFCNFEKNIMTNEQFQVNHLANVALMVKSGIETLGLKASCHNLQLTQHSSHIKS